MIKLFNGILSKTLNPRSVIVSLDKDNIETGLIVMRMITRDGHYTTREMAALLKRAKEHSTRDYVLYIVLFGTGRRIYEVCRKLRVKDIDFEHKTILRKIGRAHV